MPITDATTIKARWVFLSEVSDSIIDGEVAIAELVLNQSALGDLYQRCVELYVVHTLAVEYNDQLDLGLKIKNIDEFRNPNKADSLDYWSLTPYGKQYIKLSNSAATKVSGITMRVI